jgi:RimJ/RimL family protein N-acetyltransferase
VSGGVELRDVTSADLPVLFEHQLDPESSRMAAFPARSRDAFMAHWSRILADDTVVARTVVADGDVAGHAVSWVHGDERLVGYVIGRSFWGRGIATRALAELLSLVPDRPLHARVASHNVASLRVLEKCGFTISGRDVASPGNGVDVEEVVLVLEAGA